ncbi:hypothetical protein V9L05_15195 [Bernardetia sp. Wsw4-3y2]|uniref:hypothetical protein n=1 Tax=Bernardetia sp. Wsw4-3y2 TaxID=3127471 RepID=UPI0030CD9E13
MGVWKNRKISFETLNQITREHSQVLCIHYSYSNTYDDEYGDISPIITTIVIQSLDEQIYKQFAIHLEANKAGITKDQIQDSYMDLELRVLTQYNNFVKRNKACYWIHWDMKDMSFGFEAIKHRYEKLFENLSEYCEIPVNNCKNLSKIIEGSYGENFAEGPDTLKSLMLENSKNIDCNKYLGLREESIEFEKKNFTTVADSVDLKVKFMSIALNRLKDKKLVIPNKNYYARFEDFVTHPVFTFIAGGASIYGLISFSSIFSFIKSLFKLLF